MASITLPEALALFTKHVISVLTVDKCVLKQKSTEVYTCTSSKAPSNIRAFFFLAERSLEELHSSSGKL